MYKVKKIFKKLLILLILIIVGVGGYYGYEYLRYGSLPGSVEVYRDYYKKAKNLQEDEKFRKAYYAFSKISPRYSGYEAVLFHQAKCAASIEDERTTILKYKKLLKNYPSGILAPQSSYNLGQTYLRLGEKSLAKKQFEFTQKNYKNTDYALASNYYLGQIYKSSDKLKAFDYWKDYISKSPNGRFSLDCAEAIKAAGMELSEEEKFNLGKVFYYAQRYQSALKYLNQVSFEKSWYFRAKSYRFLARRYKSIQILKEGIKNNPDSVTKDQLWDAMSTYVYLSPRSKLSNWSDLVNMTSSNSIAGDYAIYRKALLLPKTSAYRLYEKIVKNHAEGDFASESMWNIFWREFREKNYYEALKIGKNHVESYPEKKAAPKMLFWMGKLSERLGRKSAAKNYYKKVLKTYPDSYYAFRSNGRLEAIKTGVDPGWNTDKTTKIDKGLYEPTVPYSSKEIEKLFGALIAELLAVEDYELLLSLPNKDAFLESWIKYKEGLKSNSMVIARNEMEKITQKPAHNDERWKLIYPLYFADVINESAKTNGVDPVIALSLAREESYFNHMAVSSSNARGLMQLLPGTAKDIARWKRLGRVDSFGLFNPKTNVKLGTAYLKYVEDRLYNQTVFAVAGYNGGPAAVERWLKTIPSEDIDEFVENIPYDQTRNYIKKVYRSYWNYKRIYKL